MPKPKPPPPGQMGLFDLPPVAPTSSGSNPKLPDYRPTVERYDVQRAPLAQRHSATSVEAANLMAGTRAGTLRATIWRWLLGRPAGATDEEGQQALGLDGNTYRPRRVELQEAGLVVDSKVTRLTKNKRKAVVWRAVRPEGD